VCVGGVGQPTDWLPNLEATPGMPVAQALCLTRVVNRPPDPTNSDSPYLLDPPTHLPTPSLRGSPRGSLSGAPLPPDPRCACGGGRGETPMENNRLK
jgi:hypothetical protein